MLAEMRVASARKPDNTGLGQLICEILETDSDARRMWEHETVAHVHSDGDHRQVRLPHSREVIDIELVSLAPLRATDVRLTMFVPLTEIRPGPNLRSARTEALAGPEHAWPDRHTTDLNGQLNRSGSRPTGARA